MEEKDLQNKELEKDQLENKQDEVKTFTQEEMDKLLQSETDKRVSSALKKAQDKFEAEYKAKLDAERTEADKLARMSESERLQAQFDAEKQKFENERKQFLQERLELETVKQLSDKGLPTEFSCFLVSEDADSTKNRLDVFQTQFQLAVEKAVNEKLKGHTPPQGSTGTGLDGSVTKEQFAKFGYKERLALYQSNPDLYNQLQNS